MFQQRVWILQRSNIEILRECQRLIMDQFSERISLTQGDILERIFYFHGKSNNQRFHEAVERLKMSLMEAAFDLRQLPSYDESQAGDQAVAQPVAINPPPSQPSKPQQNKVRQRMYRGQKVLVDSDLANNSTAVTAALANPIERSASAKSRKRVYRGQIIEG